MGRVVDTHTCDVLVIGAGGAALRAALAAKEAHPDSNVLVVTKGVLGESGVTATACSDRMAFHATLPHTQPGGPDNWRFHADDIYRVGGFVSDWPLAEVLAQRSAEAFRYLDELGVPFVKRPDGTADQFVTDGSQYARACYTGPYTANHIEQALVREVRRVGIPVVEHCTIADLLVEHSRTTGAMGLVDDAWVHFRAKAVVLASGGGGRAFRTSVFPPESTGDGYAMAYRTGAELVNLEFIQIGLCSLRTLLALSGSMMRAVPRIVDQEGREFLGDYFPPGTPRQHIYDSVFDKGACWPVCSEHPSSMVDVAVFKEAAQGKAVFLDFGANPEGFGFARLPDEARNRYQREMEQDLGADSRSRSPLARLRELNPQAVAWLGERGIDLARGDRMEISPAAQHFQGGVKIGPDAQTTVPGLYAAGECAGGQHGANRPGGNALLDGQVFGKIAGTQAAVCAARSAFRRPGLAPEAAAQELEARLKGGIEAAQARRIIRDTLSEFGSVIRTPHGLQTGLDRMRELEHAGIRPDHHGKAFAVETANMRLLAQMILGAARLRDESRGPHLWFEHFDDPRPRPRDDQRWRRYIVIHRGPDGMVLYPRKPVGPEAHDTVRRA